jgi:tetrapyrrole methylase family protein / MazG family protein
MAQGITILGLGPGAAEHLTLEARAVLQAASEVHLRTAQHPTVAALPAHLTVHSFDSVYEAGDTFASVYQTIADEVVKLGNRPQGVIYAVPGHPLVAEATVLAILAQARTAGLPVRVVAGLSFLEPVFTVLGVDPLAHGLQVLDATSLEPSQPFVPAAPIQVWRPLLLAQLYGEHVATLAKLTLLEFYPPDHPVTLVWAAGVPERERVRVLPLYELDRQHDLDPLTCAYVPPLEQGSELASLDAFQRIVARLRAPDGCPWDREQTHGTLKGNLLEESYEVLAALDAEDPDKLCEELGDLLLQIVLHAQIAVESEEFGLADVIRGIAEKLVRRHPHVFAAEKVADTRDLLRNWERIKQDERDQNHAEDGDRSLLSGVPPNLPALAASQSIQERASRVGFDWSGLSGVLDKLGEELGELQAARNQSERLSELGDVLFAAANAARWLDLDAEEALRLANNRFRERFQAMEQICGQRGLRFASLSLDEKNALWDEVKALGDLDNG